MFKVGDFVTRKSYNNDTVFKIKRISKDIAILGGIRLRLLVDAPLNDLNLYNNNQEIKINNIIDNKKTLKGTVLHIDGDCDYLKECMSFYSVNKIPAYGYCMPEEKIPQVVMQLLIKHKPDILVLTGHDNIKNGKYINSRYYAEGIKIAREYEKNKDSLIIIGGGCKSEYQLLIKNGANFASSPGGVNIDVLDPAIIASSASSELVDSYLDVGKIIEYTVNKYDGIGGVDTKGCARKIY